VKILISWFDRYHLPVLFAGLINKYLKVAGKNTNRIQHGYHRYYLLTYFVVVYFLILLQFFWRGAEWLPVTDLSPISIHLTLIVIIASLSVIFAASARSSLSAILAMGVLGYGIAVLFMFFGAVDLAITQFLVETILMVIFVMVIYHLPQFSPLSSKKTHLRDALISIAVGVIVTIVLLQVPSVRTEEPISGFFANYSYLMAHGRNIVNVILVDFRALDTLGEITVLALAAAGVFALLKFDKTNKDPGQ
jgi:multicomponent Na+:H+ antiporter subunit A